VLVLTRLLRVWHQPKLAEKLSGIRMGSWWRNTVG
jgi:hypothetical protein